MSKLIGKRLPRELMNKFRAQSNIRSNEVPLLISTDPDGFPNVSLLSFLDIFMQAPDRLVFAIGEDSSSKKNLLRTGKGTIAVWGGKDSGMFYIKGRVRQLKEKLSLSVEGFRLTTLLMKVERISQDHSDAAKLLTTLNYDNRAINKDHVLLFGELKKLARSLAE